MTFTTNAPQTTDGERVLITKIVITLGGTPSAADDTRTLLSDWLTLAIE